MADIKKFPEIASLNESEIDTIIELLAGYEKKTQLVREEFKYYYDKSLSLATIKEIRVKYAKRIEERALALVKNLKANPLIHRPSRYKFAWLIFKRAAQVRHRGWEKVSNDKEKPYRKKITDDPTTMIKALELCEKMDYNHSVIELKSNGGLVSEGNEDADDDHDVDSGVSGW